MVSPYIDLASPFLAVVFSTTGSFFLPFDITSSLGGRLARGFFIYLYPFLRFLPHSLSLGFTLANWSSRLRLGTDLPSRFNIDGFWSPTVCVQSLWLSRNLGWHVTPPCSDDLTRTNLESPPAFVRPFNHHFDLSSRLNCSTPQPLLSSHHGSSQVAFMNEQSLFWSTETCMTSQSKRGLSAQEKRTKMIELLHETASFYQLRELEKVRETSGRTHSSVGDR